MNSDALLVTLNHEFA